MLFPDACVEGNGAAMCGRTQFHSRILIKKGATHNGKATGIRQGAAEEPPRSILSWSMFPGMNIIEINLKELERPMGDKRI